MIWKHLLRWLVRRDTEASSTLLGGYVNTLNMLISTIVGVRYGILQGLLLYMIVHIAKSVIGFVDIRYFRATAYRNAYISEKTPNYVRILKTKPSKA